jgi:hypothetical protein
MRSYTIHPIAHAREGFWITFLLLNIILHYKNI